jgi:hypothetical protein
MRRLLLAAVIGWLEDCSFCTSTVGHAMMILLPFLLSLLPFAARAKYFLSLSSFCSIRSEQG